MLDDFYPPKIIRFDQSDHSAVHAKFHINSTVFDHVINMSGLDLKAMHDMNIKKKYIEKVHSNAIGSKQNWIWSLLIQQQHLETNSRH